MRLGRRQGLRRGVATLTALACIVLLTTSTSSSAAAAPTRSAPAPIGAPQQGVRPEVRRLDLAGVDAAAAAEARSAAPGRRAVELAEAGVDGDRLDDAPELLTGPITVPPFDAVGISWTAIPAGAPVVWVRARERSGWSAWQLLPPVDIGADADSVTDQSPDGRVFSEPLVTNGADAVQVRIDATTAVHGVRADVIDAGESPADARLAGAAPPRPTSRQLSVGSTSALRVAAGAASPAVPQPPTIVTRAQWGADESLRSDDPAYASSIKVGVVHHTASTNGYTASTAPAQLRSIYAYHTLSLGWSDIAYNFLVDRDGRVFEGRYGGVDRAVIGAATGGFNRFTFSVSALGSFGEIAAPSAMVEAIARVMAWKFAIHHVDPMGRSELTSAGADTSRYAAGQVVTVDNVMGHRDTNVTSCPGSNLYGRIGEMRWRIKELLPAGLVHPSMSVTQRTPTTNGSVRATSGFLYGGTWALTVTDRNGGLVRQDTGVGQSVDVTWPMVTQAGAPVPEGTYHLSLTAEQNGASAQPYGQWLSTSGFAGNFEGLRVTPSGTVASGWAAVSNGGVATVALVTDGTAIVRAQADQARPDVGIALPMYGPARGFSALPSMSPGPHTVCAWAEAPGLLSALLGCRTVQNLRSEPIGNVEGAASLYGGVGVSGWMLDRDSSDPITARFYVDAAHGGDARADRSRPDVGNAFPGYGDGHGFTAALPTGPGQHSVCVNGINVGAGSSEGHLRCVFAEPLTGPPIGNFEMLQAGSGGVRVVGWALDPDERGPVALHVYVGGTYESGGVYRGALSAGLTRPDLSVSFPLMGTAHGFDGTVGTSTAGSSSVCVYAINAGPPAPNPLLGCKAFG
ncbi:MAG: N-acetylmuramoyl-L-alanine amidase [Acidimicrobiales bacterium]